MPSNNKLLRKTNQNPVFLYISCTSCFQCLCRTQQSQFLDESTWCVYSQVIQITFQPLWYLLFQIPLVQYNHWNNSHDYCPHFSDFSGKNLIFFNLTMLQLIALTPQPSGIATSKSKSLCTIFHIQSKHGICQWSMLWCGLFILLDHVWQLSVPLFVFQDYLPSTTYHVSSFL